MPVSQDEFRDALSHFASGITVVSTKDTAGKLHGITVSAFCSVSLDPPLILVCIEKMTGSHQALLNSKAFVVNILSEDQSHISEHFASIVPDKFYGIDFETGTSGLPVLKGIAVSLECSTRAAHDAGDHTIFVGEVENIKIRSGNPLIHSLGEYRTLGD